MSEMSDPLDPRIRFTEAIVEWLRLRAREDITLLPFLAPLIRGMRDGFDDLVAVPPASQTGMDEPEGLSSLLTGLSDTPVHGTVQDLRRHLYWHPAIAPSPRRADDGIRVAFIHGDAGVLGCERLKTGFLMLPAGGHTPLIETVTPTFYTRITGDVTLQQHLNGQALPLEPETYSVTPRIRVHRLATAPGAPALVFFARTGNLSAPLNVWEPSPQQDWLIVPHSEDADGVWWPGMPEPADPERVAEETLNPA